MELELKNRLNLTASTFCAAHIPYNACAPQGAYNPPSVLSLKINSFTFTPLLQGPYKSRETEESQFINIFSKHAHRLMLRYSSHVTKAFGSNRWTAARLYCLIKPMKKTSHFLNKGKSFHITDYFHRCYIFQQTFWLVNLFPFSSCNHDWEEALPRPTNAAALNKFIPEVCNISMNPKRWIAHTSCEILGREERVSLDTKFSVPSAEVIPQRGQFNQEFSAR